MDINQLDWQKTNGLIPAIVQDGQTGRVLMLGFMNQAALEKTLKGGLVTFWSRSRQALWTKGETSGNYLRLKEIRKDCDGDALIVVVEPQGPTCHRGTLSCFGEDNEFTALEFLGYLERLIENRQKEMPDGSYTASLFAQGLPQIAKKVGEEAIEVVLTVSQDKARSVEEAADLLYHLLVFLAQRGVTLSEMMEELKGRHLRRN
ncbi:bifunctional phosphoribosyl-AMP cyclohydrolase/phosphoribosyl-ATP diphosphatase HisIE [Acidobacteria bacterium AH-259-O06]|nr:bifunctional phosphoribosyl-AMP cyclohydrolase/phosphoribosyl-ATP diphosphatase HisIE [Acidobacteria bacterium AH-259-L09]MDA2926782.1 bifunctional phosphoribosyl-AMP cyclohydrolase/phosphoribosyl-ATP diphosphatase HisIE [Acidobacteria bacterium AH-259-G07]MDA2929816.1 bifunctional phosphoribosyl-AMP cyclohydrolase/phosphoribosyl-ATP diphosphatase HisIE [Acidobacteria bacterium AH-259-O06]